MRYNRRNERICAITAAMSDGTGLEEWRGVFPQRFFDVGIAEEHALTFAAGLAANGMRPCAAIYSTFLQRGYDNIIHDIALQGLPVVIGVDRAGLNPKDGATHHGIFDVAFLSQIPGITIYAPTTAEGLRRSLKAAFELNAPAAIRYPSGKENSEVVSRFYSGGYGELGLKKDFDEADAVIITYGRIVAEAMKAADRLREQGIRVGIILLEILKPYDRCAELVAKALPANTRSVLFLEEEIRSGGMGMNLSDKLRGLLEQRGLAYDILATDDDFVAVVEKEQSIYAAAGVDAEHICQKIKDITQ